MFNLLSGEFYKWRKSKSFKVCCLVTIAFVVLIYGCLIMADKIQKGEMENGEYGFYVEEEDGLMLDSTLVPEVEQGMLASVAGVVTAVFVSIFVIGEYGNGAIKNIVGKGTKRSSIFFAKYIMAVLAVVVMQLISTAATLLGGLVVFGKDCISVEIMKDLCPYVGIQLLLGAAFTGVVIAIGELSRSVGVGISISVGILMLGSLLFSGMDLFFYKMDFKPSNYWIVNLINQCPLNDISGDFVMRAIFAAAFWIVVSGAIGLFHFQKADVK